MTQLSVKTAITVHVTPENTFACVQNIWLPVTACKGVCAISPVVPENPQCTPFDHTTPGSYTGKAFAVYLLLLPGLLRDARLCRVDWLEAQYYLQQSNTCKLTQMH